MSINSHRKRSSQITFDQTLLQAVFSLQEQLCVLSLNLPSGDRLLALHWQDLTYLRELSTKFTERVAQGTFSFLPRVSSLETLSVDYLDHFSVPCLEHLTNLTSLNLCLASPERGTLSVEQARQRSDDALLHLKSLSKLRSLDFTHEASVQGIVHLTALCSLTSLTLRLPSESEAALSVWEVQRLFQRNTFMLQHLHFEFKMDHVFATATMSEHRATGSWLDGLQFLVPWSSAPVFLKAGIMRSR